MAQAEDLETTKKVLRSLLISARHGLTERDLLRDYLQVTGERLNYRMFGHVTLLSFLRSMPDVVRIVPNLSSGVLLFGEIGDNKDVQRVASLVARSKVSRSKLNIRSMSTVSRPSPPSRYIPASVKLKFRTLMLSYSNGMPLDKFLDAYAKRFGYYITLSQLGFSDIRSALATVPDVVKIEFNEQLKQYYVKGVQQTTRIFCQDQNQKSVEENHQPPSGNCQPATVNSQPPKPADNSSRFPVNTQSSMHSLETSPPKTVPPPPVKVPVSRTTPGVPEKRKLAQQLRMLLSCHRGGLCATKVPMEFKLVFKETLPWDRLGYTSVVQFLSSMPEVCTLQRTSTTGNWIVFVREEGMRGDKPSDARVPKEIADRIRRVLSDNPDGVLLSKFSSVYKNVTFSELFVPDFGFLSMKDLLKSVEGVSVVAGGGDSPSLVLLETDIGIHQEEDEEEEKEEEVESMNLEVRQPSFIAAKGVQVKASTRSQSYTRQHVNCSSIGIPVYVSYIKSPSCLSLQLIGNDTSRALESLMEDTMQYYNSIDGDKLVLKSEPVVGEPVCAPYNSDGYWYRGEIQSLPAPDTAEVYYVDYGNTAVIPRGSLRRPKAHYLALPAQALQARMANLQPAGGSWNMRAATLLYQMTVDKPIIAIVTSIKNHCLSVCLCDTTSRKDVHINDKLVSQGLAVFEPDTIDDEASYDGYQLEPPASEESKDVDKIRMPSTTSAAAALSGKVASSNYQQNLIQLLLAQQNALLLKQQSQMMTNTISSSNRSGTGVPPPPGFGPVPQTNDPLPATAQSPPPAVASSLPPPSPTASTSASLSPPVTPSTPTPSAALPIPSAPPSSSSPSLPSSSSPSLPSSSSQPVSGSCPTLSPPNPDPQSSALSSASTDAVADAPKSSAEERPLIKRVDLTKSHSVHLLCYNESPFALSTEISKWFWKHDQLQGMLRRSQEHIWSLCLMKESEPVLFQAMADCDAPMLQYVGKNKTSIIVYSLDDIPRIVKVFSGPDNLMQSVIKLADQWKKDGLEIFSKKTDDDLLEKLKRLQLMRTIILKKMVVRSSGHEEPLGEGSVEKLMIVEKEIAQVTNLLESTKPSNASTTEEKGAAALNSSNTTYADSLVFSDLSEDSISTPKNSPPPPEKASTPNLPSQDPLPGPPPGPVISDSPLSQVPPNNSLLGVLPFPHQSVPFLSQPVIPSQHGLLFPPTVKTPQIQQPPPSNWKPSQMPIPATYISSYVPQQGSWGWAQPLNAPVFHQPQLMGGVFRHNVPLLSNFALSSVHPVTTRLVPTLRNPAPASPKAATKKVKITAPSKKSTTTTSLSPSRSVVQTKSVSKTSTTATSAPVQATAMYNTSTSCTSTNQSSTPIQITPTSNISTHQSDNTVQTTAVSKTSTSWETASGGNQSSEVEQQSITIDDSKVSAEVKTSQSTSSTPSISQPSTIASRSLTSTPHQPVVSRPSTPQPAQPLTTGSRPPPLYSRVTVSTLSKSSVGLGRGKSLATLSPPSPRSVGVGRGHSITGGWHTIQSRRNPITAPESFPPIGSGAGLDII